MRPVLAGRGITDMMAHARGARREARQVGTAFLLALELRPLDAGPDLVVADHQGAALGDMALVLEGLDLDVAPLLQLLGRGRVVAVAIDDHRRFLGVCMCSCNATPVPARQSWVMFIGR